MTILATTRGSSGLLDLASLFLLVVLLVSFHLSDYRRLPLRSFSLGHGTLLQEHYKVLYLWFGFHTNYNFDSFGRRAFLRSRLPYDVDGARLFHLINLSGDIHPNPGPPRQRIKYPCGECNRNVRSNQGRHFVFRM